MSLRIIIADDELLFRKAMIPLIHEFGNMEVVAEAGNGKELLQQVQSWKGYLPDVLLLDISMPEMNGMDAFPEIKRKMPALKIVMLSVFADDRHIITMIEQGANGYLFKNAEPEEVKKTILSVVEKDFYFNETVMRVMQKNIHAKRNRAIVAQTDHLSTREKEILQLICREYTSAEIAQQLFISERTVDGHRNNLLLKTGARNTAGLVIYAIRHNIAEVTEG